MAVSSVASCRVVDKGTDEQKRHVPRFSVKTGPCDGDLWLLCFRDIIPSRSTYTVTVWK